MSSSYSPLRYPGGKQVLLPTLRTLIEANGFSGSTYVEPYAGGAGAALGLLFGEHVDQLLLNDADVAVYSFWKSILEETDAFLELVRTTPLDVSEWKRQKAVYSNPRQVSRLRLGFAAFYLNRCNRSGIIANAGVIGGLDQNGPWKMDVRFNRTDLCERILRIARYGDRIQIHNLDAITFLDQHVNLPKLSECCFVYLDPPYYAKGSQLYLSYYNSKDHSDLSGYLRTKAKFAWVLTYDDAAEIRTLYSGLSIVPFQLRYSASASRTGSEVFISTNNFAGVKSSLSAIVG